MPARRPDPLDEVARGISDLYVLLEDFQQEASNENRTRLLDMFRDLRVTIDGAEEHLVARTAPVTVTVTVTVSGSPVALHEVPAVPPHAGPLIVGNVYTRNDLRDLFDIRDMTLNNGVFPVKGANEVWLFVTENKQADREQYVDKLSGELLHWQGQKQGRTDPLIIDHRQNGDLLLLFYRTAKYQFEGAGFVFEGPFEYVSHSGGFPTSFVLRRQAVR